MIDHLAPNEILGKNVIKRLKEISPIPRARRGGVILAGAAVASAVIEELGLSDSGFNIVYNDVDAFINIDAPDHQEEIKRINFERRQKVITSLNGKMEFDFGGYGEIIPTKVRKYKVKYTSREGMLNKVFVQFFSNKDDSTLKTLDTLISAFDFNSVQVGVDVQTGLLFGTPAFWNFIGSKQFEVQNLNTPSHTLIRFLKKKKEIGDGVFFDEKQIINACLMAIQNADTRKTGIDDDIPANFGKETLVKAMSVFDELSQYVYIKEEEHLVNTYQTYRFSVKFDMLDKAYKDVSVLYSSSTNYHMERLPISEIISIQALATKGRKSDKNFLRTVFDKSDKYKNLSDVINFKPSFFIAQQHKDEGTLSQINQLLSHRLTVHVSRLGLDGAKDLTTKLHALEKKYGELVYGIVENTYTWDPIDMEDLEKKIVEEQKKLTEPLVEYSFKNIKISDYEIKELVDSLGLKKEGEYMRHCVGGYSHSVKKRDTKIISFRHDSDKSKHITVELKKAGVIADTQATAYYIAQSKKYRNSNPSTEEMELVEDLLNQASIANIELISYERYKEMNKQKNNGVGHPVPYIDIDEDEIPF